MTSSRDISNAQRGKQKLYTNASATGTVTLDCSLYNWFELTLTGNTTLAMSNVPSLTSEKFAVYVSVNQGSTAFTLTHATSTPITSGGTAPATPGANKRADFVYETKNGTSWDLFAGPAT